MRYDVGVDEFGGLSVEGLAALRVSRRNAAMGHKRLSVDQYGFLVTEWNYLDPVERGKRADYCRDHKHRYVVGPYVNFHVCIRCFVSVSG
jgi:hypothetical protein